MDLGLETLVLVKPGEFEKLDRESAERCIAADQRVLSVIGKAIVEEGEEQLKAKTGYTDEHLPSESPVYTPPFTLDGITFELMTTVRGHNPLYQEALDKITAFLESLVIDWNEGRRKTGVRTFPNRETKEKEPFIEWNYLMHRVCWYADRVRELGVENKFAGIKTPPELDEMVLDRLAIPLGLAHEFDINQPGAAKLWYLARRFYGEVEEETKKRLEREMEGRSGIREMPPETKKYWEQVEKYLVGVKAVSSPRRQAGKTFNRLFKVPQKDKPKKSTDLPVLVTPNNFLALLEEYRPLLSTSLEKWKEPEGKIGEKIGELITFYYGIQTAVQKKFPFLPQYQLHHREGKMFVSLLALYSRIEALQRDYMVNRILHTHTIKPIV